MLIGALGGLRDRRSHGQATRSASPPGTSAGRPRSPQCSACFASPRPRRQPVYADGPRLSSFGAGLSAFVGIAVHAGGHSRETKLTTAVRCVARAVPRPGALSSITRPVYVALRSRSFQSWFPLSLPDRPASPRVENRRSRRTRLGYPVQRLRFASVLFGRRARRGSRPPTCRSFTRRSGWRHDGRQGWNRPLGADHSSASGDRPHPPRRVPLRPRSLCSTSTSRAWPQVTTQLLSMLPLFATHRRLVLTSRNAGLRSREHARFPRKAVPPGVSIAGLAPGESRAFVFNAPETFVMALRRSPCRRRAAPVRPRFVSSALGRGPRRDRVPGLSEGHERTEGRPGGPRSRTPSTGGVGSGTGRALQGRVRLRRAGRRRGLELRPRQGTQGAPGAPRRPCSLASSRTFPEAADAERVIRTWLAGHRLILGTDRSATWSRASRSPRTQGREVRARNGLQDGGEPAPYDSRTTRARTWLGVLAGGVTKSNTLGVVPPSRIRRCSATSTRSSWEPRASNPRVEDEGRVGEQVVSIREGGRRARRRS